MDEEGVRSEEDRVAHEVIGAAIAVHRALGPGYLESVYEAALAVELEARGVAFERQVTFALHYRGRPVGGGKLDFLVGSCVVVELKAVEAFADIHLAQIISYLKATGHHLGLLINFNVPVLKQGIRRIAL